MSEVPALLALAGGIVLVVLGAELFFDGVLAVAGRLGVSAFGLTAVISGFELENLAAGIAANARGLSGAAAGTFLGGTTFLALGVAGLAALVAPIRARLPLGRAGLDRGLAATAGGLCRRWPDLAAGGRACSWPGSRSP
jgi:Ca2+/Na+ antiporter